MPTAEEILRGLGLISNGWPLLAAIWHLYFAALVGLVIARRIDMRVLGTLLALPLASVSIIAWSTGNPFNGTVFAVLTVTLGVLARRLPSTRAAPAHLFGLTAGAALFAFGWLYPHFLETDTALAYLIFAPLGLIPCPTLSAAIALVLMVGGMGHRPWTLALWAVGLFYGLFGVFYLGVALDWGLVIGALCLLVLTFTGEQRSS